jgi:protein-S-isoprenylcysteine O-methyltransferase Ste14
MGDPIFRYGLLAYYTVFVGVLFVARSIIVRKRTGVNPLVLPKEGEVALYVSRGLQAVCAGGAGVVLAIGLAPFDVLGALPALRSQAVFIVGCALLGASLVLIAVAQAQMGASWRIGIDREHPTALVERGLFAMSRNPIFLALRANLLGLVLVYPAAATLALLVAAEIFIQLQVRLEEGYLSTLHGERYEAYRRRVRRWL